MIHVQGIMKLCKHPGDIQHTVTLVTKGEAISSRLATSPASFARTSLVLRMRYHDHNVQTKKTRLTNNIEMWRHFTRSKNDPV